MLERRRPHCPSAGQSDYTVTVQRRKLLLSSLAAGLGPRAARPLLTQSAGSVPKKIAAVVTEHRENSHADVIVGKYLDGYRQNGPPAKRRLFRQPIG